MATEKQDKKQNPGSWKKGRRPAGAAAKWKPGQSGNPRGRPKKAICLTSMLKAEVERICPQDAEGRTWMELIVIATMRLAMAGNPTALKEVWERIDGKTTTPLALEGLEGAEVTFRINPGQSASARPEESNPELLQ
jgi:hypothetical protein